MPRKPPKSLQVYIPTLNRIGFNRQVSLREFLMHSSYKPFIVCPPNELKAHQRYYKKVIPCPANGIGPTRQWLLDNAQADYVVMCDDDMRFSYRPDPKVVKLERLEDLDKMLDLIRFFLDKGFIHGGVGARQGNNRKDLSKPRYGELLHGYLVQRCERVNNFHFMNRKKVRRLARFDELPVMEDFHFTLKLLTQGKPNVVIHQYVWNQEGSGADGGCSGYRTPQVQAEGAEGLHAAFPDYVRVVTKTSKDTSPAWKDFKERKDVVVQWVKAARDAGVDV